MKTYILVCNMW